MNDSIITVPSDEVFIFAIDELRGEAQDRLLAGLQHAQSVERVRADPAGLRPRPAPPPDGFGSIVTKRTWPRGEALAQIARFVGRRVRVLLHDGGELLGTLEHVDDAEVHVRPDRARRTEVLALRLLSRIELDVERVGL